MIERISSQGPMPFAAFMSLALYHPEHGYYAGGATRTGFGGDFVTSSELGPIFGALWARAFETTWRACGEPERFEIVEVGGGEGGFAESVLASVKQPFASAVEYRLIERVSGVEDRQRTRLARFDNITWSRSLMEVPPFEAGCIFANEVLDNLPVHVVAMTDKGLMEVCVETDGERLTERLRPPSNPKLERYVDAAGVILPSGHRFEVNLAASSFVSHASRAFGTGAVYFVDYGAEAKDLVRRPAGSLVCYSRSGVDDRPLERPGDKDITTHVNWTAVHDALGRQGMDVYGPTPQRRVLDALGAADLDAALRARHSSDVAHGEGSGALRVLSQRQSLAAIRDEGGLGGLGVMAGVRGIEPPRFLSR